MHMLPRHKVFSVDVRSAMRCVEHSLTGSESRCVQSVGRGNLEEFMAYGFYNAAWEALNADTQRQIRVFLERVEAAWGVRIAHEGRNPDVTFMRHLWEPLR